MIAGYLRTSSTQQNIEKTGRSEKLFRFRPLARLSHANSSRDAARSVLTRRTQVFPQGCVNTLPKGKIQCNAVSAGRSKSQQKAA